MKILKYPNYCLYKGLTEIFGIALHSDLEFNIKSGITL